MFADDYVAAPRRGSIRRIWSALFLIGLLAQPMEGLARDKPRACNGKDRRPANPHGSVLPGSPLPATVTAQPDTSPGKPPVMNTVPNGAPPKPAASNNKPAKPQRLSSLPSYPSC